jgi:hypothetical protein
MIIPLLAKGLPWQKNMKNKKIIFSSFFVLGLLGAPALFAADNYDDRGKESVERRKRSRSISSTRGRGNKAPVGPLTIGLYKRCGQFLRAERIELDPQRVSTNRTRL